MQPITANAQSRFLVCVDNQPESRTALRLACLKAAARGIAIDLLHVLAPADFQTLGIIAERMQGERRGEGELLLKGLAEEARAHGVEPGLLLREGAVGEEIIAAVQADPRINLAIIGTAHQTAGRGTLAAWLAGQLGSKLFVPLLMIPGNLTDQQLQALV
ncbi:MAG: universal stress protein [Pseudomonadota bacterium]|nr:universal stress protein [Pseudomonadota bacterium]